MDFERISASGFLYRLGQIVISEGCISSTVRDIFSLICFMMMSIKNIYSFILHRNRLRRIILFLTLNPVEFCDFYGICEFEDNKKVADIVRKVFQA